MRAKEKTRFGHQQESSLTKYRGFILSVLRACQHSRSLPRKHLRRRGVVLIWVVVVFFTTLLFFGLSLDTAKVALVLHQMQNASDAAALAGGPWVKRDRDEACRLAQAMAALNYADANNVLLDLNVDNLASGDIVVGRYRYDPDAGEAYFTRFDPLAADPIPVNALAVMVSRDEETRAGHLGSREIALNFGPVAGVDTIALTGDWQSKGRPYAIAMTAGGSGAGLICLRHDGTGLDVEGTGVLTVNNITDPFILEDGAIQVNSFDDELSVTTNGTPEVNADVMNISADNCTQVGNFEFPPEPDMYVNFRQPPMPDPLKWFQDVPPVPGADLGGIRIVNMNQVPTDPIPAGYYSGGLDLQSGDVNTPIVLAPGIYILDGEGLQTGANSHVVAEGVFFYIVGDGEVHIGGGGYIYATPMTEGIYEGLIMAQHPDDLNSAYITGNADSLIEGTLYFPQHVEDQKHRTDFALQLGGTGLGTGNQIIADSVYVFGTGDKIINYDGRNPSPITTAYLVE